MATDPMTYKQLDDVLAHLGFARRRFEPKWLHYEHPKSGTVIILVEKKPSEFVRVSDAVSARRHLVEKGFIGAEEIDAILSRNENLQKTPSAKKRYLS
jgi:hypothetical protein